MSLYIFIIESAYFFTVMIFNTQKIIPDKIPDKIIFIIFSLANKIINLKFFYLKLERYQFVL